MPEPLPEHRLAPAETTDVAIDVSARRRACVTGFLVFMLAGHAFDVGLRRDDWPFSQYAMYSERQGPLTTREAVVGVTAAGDEVPIDVREELKPFDPTRLSWGLKRARKERSSGAQHAALQKVLTRYNTSQARRAPGAAPLVGLRVYRESWKLEPGKLAVPRSVRRKLLMDYSTQPGEPRR